MVGNDQTDTCWDVFVSYASEDRTTVAEPLAELLRQMGASVWFDQFELRVGDSLRRRMDDGLARSRYGIVILSPAFLSKHWTVRELDGLAQREADGVPVLLPVWHGLDIQAVRAYSPPLADRVALKWSDGMSEVAIRLLEVVRPDLLHEAEHRLGDVVPMTRLRRGAQFTAIFAGAAAHVFHHDEVAESDSTAFELIADLAGWADGMDVLLELSSRERIEADRNIDRLLDQLDSFGWEVLGCQRPCTIRHLEGCKMAIVAVLPGEDRRAFSIRDSILVVPTVTE